MKKLFVILFLVFFTHFSSAQCAMCKAVVENGDSDLAEGINSGIVYLMAFPYLIFALVVYYFYRKYKRSHRKV
jgi:hypothetical protein